MNELYKGCVFVAYNIMSYIRDKKAIHLLAYCLLVYNKILCTGLGQGQFWVWGWGLILMALCMNQTSTVHQGIHVGQVKMQAIGEGMVTRHIIPTCIHLYYYWQGSPITKGMGQTEEMHSPKAVGEGHRWWKRDGWQLVGGNEWQWMDCEMSSYMYALKCGTIIMSSKIIV